MNFRYAFAEPMCQRGIDDFTFFFFFETQFLEILSNNRRRDSISVRINLPLSAHYISLESQCDLHLGSNRNQRSFQAILPRKFQFDRKSNTSIVIFSSQTDIRRNNRAPFIENLPPFFLKGDRIIKSLGKG